MTDSIEGLQQVAKERLDELYHRVSDEQGALDRTLIAKRAAEEAVTALEAERERLTVELKRLEADVAFAQTQLTDAQAKTMARLEAADRQAAARIEAADSAQRRLEQTKGALHSLREQTRAVLCDAAELTTDALARYTQAHQQATQAMDALLRVLASVPDPSSAEAEAVGPSAESSEVS